MHSHEMFVCCLVFNWMVQNISTDVYTYRRYASDLLVVTIQLVSADSPRDRPIGWWSMLVVYGLPVYLFTVPYVNPTC